jgi:hypothetical protein
MSGFDVASTIVDFLADPSKDSLELPQMSAGQRKETKKIMEQYPQLRCESYGFGVDRQMHIFKRSASSAAQDERSATSAVSIKNTFIDGWLAAEPEPLVFRSLQAPFNTDNLDFFSGARNVGQLDGSSDCSTSASGEGVSDSLSRPAFNSCNSSPLSEKREIQMPMQVRNTFIHVQTESIDERAVQSMPHGMFGQFIAKETAQRDSNGQSGSAFVEAVLSPPESHETPHMTFSPGAFVVVEGLVKSPAFNGLSAVVQNWDEASGRYNILIARTNSACQQAKIKQENLRLLLPSP